MSRYVLSPRAQRDLDSVWDYSASTWGVDHAESYVTTIWTAIMRVAGQPKQGRPCPEIRRGYFKVSAGQHVIFYRCIADGIDVVRILHASMDFDRHL